MVLIEKLFIVKLFVHIYKITVFRSKKLSLCVSETLHGTYTNWACGFNPYRRLEEVSGDGSGWVFILFHINILEMVVIY